MWPAVGACASGRGPPATSQAPSPRSQRRGLEDNSIFSSYSNARYSLSLGKTVHTVRPGDQPLPRAHLIWAIKTPLLLRFFWGVPGGSRDVCGGVRSVNQLKVTRGKLFVLMRSKFPFIQTTPQSRYFVR
jgi:hypothetical protein